MIAIRIKQQVGRLNNEDAAVTDLHTGGEIQPADKILELVEASVAIRVFTNRDSIRPFRSARRRVGDTVVFGAKILIDADRLEPGGRRILEVLDHPHPAALVERDGQRLPNFRFVGDELHFEAVGNFHVVQRLLG